MFQMLRKAIEINTFEKTDSIWRKLARQVRCIFTTEKTVVFQPESTIDGTYRVTGKLGSGGTSTVYAAFDSDLNRELAIKVLHPIHDDAPALTRIRREARVLSRLCHPNIVQVFRVGFIDECRPFIVMELVKGSSLRQLLDKEHNLPCQRAIDIGLQVCAALEYAHSQEVIHRDLKPENIILDESFAGETRIKLIDFGLCKRIDPSASTGTLTESGTLVGTANYMSPEQCLGKPLDKTSDIYSFGCVFYELLTGSAPFKADVNSSVLVKHLSASFPRILDLDPGCGLPLQLQALLLKCTAKAKQDRYQDFAEVARDLAEIGTLNCTAVVNSERLNQTTGKVKEACLKAGLFVSLLVLVMVIFSAFLLGTDTGSVCLTVQIQNSLPEKDAVRLLGRYTAWLIEQRRIPAGRKVVDATSRSKAYFVWPLSARANLLSQYITAYRKAGLSKDALRLYINLLGQLLEAVRNVDPPTPARLLDPVIVRQIESVSRELLDLNLDEASWKEVSRVFEKYGQLEGIKRSPQLVWFSVLSTESMLHQKDVVTADRLHELVGACISTGSICAASSVDMADCYYQKGTTLALNLSEPSDAYYAWSNMCLYHLKSGRLETARQDFKTARKFFSAIAYPSEMLSIGFEALKAACTAGSYQEYQQEREKRSRKVDRPERHDITIEMLYGR
jgi:serine/threonine protein kinase